MTEITQEFIESMIRGEELPKVLGLEIEVVRVRDDAALLNFVFVDDEGTAVARLGEHWVSASGTITLADIAQLTVELRS